MRPEAANSSPLDVYSQRQLRVHRLCNCRRSGRRCPLRANLARIAAAAAAAAECFMIWSPTSPPRSLMKAPIVNALISDRSRNAVESAGSACAAQIA